MLKLTSLVSLTKFWKPPIYYVEKDSPHISKDILKIAPIYLNQYHDLYSFKVNPKHITVKERLILDIPPDYLPCKDFTFDEALDNFVQRVEKGFFRSNYNSNPAHDLPRYPKF